MKIAVIGSGISGMSAAWLLSTSYQVDLYEKDDYIGGHSNTVEITHHGKKIAVDTGFIVFNHQTYPNLTAFFDLLGVKTIESEMSFSASINDGFLEYSGKSLSTIFAQKKNLINPTFLLMLRDILKFNKNASQILESDENPTLGEFLDSLKIGEYCSNYYLLAMAAAIWSCPLETMKKYPAKSFVRFFHNHGLLTVSDQPIWRTVQGGSREYIKLLCDKFKKNIFINSKIYQLRKSENGKIEVNGKIYDKVVIATHSDQAASMLDDFPKAQEIISKISYQKNLAVLHCDRNLMPKRKKVWSSWNYLNNHNDKQNQGHQQGVCLTYWMNLLQQLDNEHPVFVTLNPNKEINPKTIFTQIEYDHPVFDFGALEAQKQIESIQGNDNLYFCGAYLGYGFHEDGLNSALKVAEYFNIKAPWKK